MSDGQTTDEEKPRKVDIRRILVATDGSAQAFRALNEAIYIAALCDAQITLLMTVDLNDHVSAFEQVSMSGYVSAELKIAAYKFLADLMHVIPTEIPAHALVESGDPADAIVEVSEREDSDLIVIGSRGMSTLKSFFMGSVSQQVLQRAKCPVLVSKGMPDDWDEEADQAGFLPRI